MVIFLTHPKEVLYKSQHCLTLITTRTLPKVDFIRAQNLGIFDILGWIKFLLEKKIIHSPDKSNNLREAILFDHTSEIGITISGELTQLIQEGRMYQFYNLNLNIFFGKNYPQHLLQLQS